MANVWYEELGHGRYRVQWRNRWTETAEGQRRPKGSLTVGSDTARDALMGKIRLKLDLDGHYEHEIPRELAVANLETAAAAWIRHRAARMVAASSTRAAASAWARLQKDILAVERIAEGKVISVQCLKRDLFTRLLERWSADKLSEGRQYGLACYLLRVWTWAGDAPDEWPGVPPAPRDPSSVLPPPPVRGRAPDAPKPEEMDAICRRAARSGIADLADICATMRLTGLRISQVLSINVGDFDLAHATLTVRSGKSRREKADQRTMPVHRGLLDRLRPRLVGRAEDAYLFPPVRAQSSRRQLADDIVMGLWEEATKTGEVRRAVWSPPSRKKKRPNHAFRAGFLALLRAKGVAESVRFELVGHEPKSVEGLHYSAPTMQDLRSAIDSLEDVNWTAPLAAAPRLALVEGGR
jgi:integrase